MSSSSSTTPTDIDVVLGLEPMIRCLATVVSGGGGGGAGGLRGLAATSKACRAVAWRVRARERRPMHVTVRPGDAPLSTEAACVISSITLTKGAELRAPRPLEQCTILHMPGDARKGGIGGGNGDDELARASAASVLLPALRRVIIGGVGSLTLSAYIDDMRNVFAGVHVEFEGRLSRRRRRM